MAPLSAASTTDASSYLLPLPSDPKLSKEVAEALSDIEHQFALDGKLLNKIIKQMLWEFEKGLGEHGTEETRDTFLPMIPTYIHNVPDGTETGTFLALDLGGTNLRVCSVTLSGDSKFTLQQEKFKVSEELKTGKATVLFDYIAKSVGGFLQKQGIKTQGEDDLYLGFTFSFPVEQTALDKGKLISWTKGFEATGAIGIDVVSLLQDALDRAQIAVKCSALVNDTVGTLLSRAYQSGNALVGGIFGTGTNGAYVEKLDKIKKPLPTGKAEEFEFMIVNTEWGAFDNERVVLRVTPFDNKVDRESINPRKQAFEKMVSGMYMGEIVRNVLMHLIDHNLLFSGHSSKILNTHYGLDTALMSAIEEHPKSAYGSGASDVGDLSEWRASLEETKDVLVKQLGVPEKYISTEDCLVVRRVSEIVGTRGARLSAVAIAAVLFQTGHDKATVSGQVDELHVGVDGSLVEFYPGFEVRMREALREALGEECERKVKIGLAKDGSGVGAALTALQAFKQRQAIINKDNEAKKELKQDHRTQK